MALNQIGIGVVISARDLASGVISRVRNSLGGLRDGVRQFGGATKMLAAGVSTLATGVGALGGLAYIAHQVAPFEKALASLAAVSGATAEQLRALEQAAIDAGIKTKFTPTQAAEALTDLASAGYNVDQSIKLLIPTLDLAAASLGQLAPDQAAGVASSALKAFGLEADQAGVVVDKLTKTMNLFAVQAKDLPLGIANSVRGASALNQTLDETLISFGLIRNIMPRTESAATAVSTAMERLVKPEVQHALRGLGVDVVGADGKFRNFLDVIAELQPAIEKMGDAKGAAFLQETFGTEALSGITAITKQLKSGIADGNGEILRGAAAVAHLRAELAASAGEAGRFGSKMAETLPGQIELLKGAGESLLIEVGKPLAAALKPAVEVLRDGIQGVVTWLRRLSPETKAAIARFVLIAATIVTVAGAFVSGVAAASLLVSALGGIASVAGAVAGAFAPVALAIGAATLAFFGFRSAYEQNVGGLADAASGGLKKAAIAFEAFGQAFSQGGFSGAVRDELNKAENAGLKQFVVNTYSFVMRAKHLLEQLAEGFQEGVKAAGPAIEGLVAALDGLGNALGIAAEGDDPAAKWQRWGEIGRKVGGYLAEAFRMIVKGATWVAEAATGAVQTFEGFGPIVTAVVANGKDLYAAFSDAGNALAGAGITARSVGQALGRVASAIVSAIGGAIRYAGALLSSFLEIFTGVFKQIKGILTGDWAMVWEGVQQVVIGAIKIMANMLLGFVEQLAAAIDAIGALANKDLGARKKIAGFRENVDALFETTTVSGENAQKAASPQATMVTMPDTEPVQKADEHPFAALMMANQLRQEQGLRGDDLTAAVREGMAKAPAQPINATMLVDGQVLGQIAIKAAREEAVAGGLPVSLEGG